jgi:hypothetical protein
MNRISFAALVAGAALALGAPMASAADAPEIDRALGYTKFFSGHCVSPTHVAERPIGAGLSQVNGLFACDTMLLIMFAHHPGLMMVQFMVRLGLVADPGLRRSPADASGAEVLRVERIYFGQSRRCRPMPAPASSTSGNTS